MPLRSIFDHEKFVFRPYSNLITKFSDQILKLNLPTGIPFVYELDENLTPLVSMKFLCDDRVVKIEMDKVKNQTK